MHRIVERDHDRVEIRWAGLGVGETVSRSPPER
jgi:hypothetical protein